jgi:RNA binding exosome subunit
MYLRFDEQKTIQKERILYMYLRFDEQKAISRMMDSIVKTTQPKVALPCFEKEQYAPQKPITYM